MLPTFRMGGSLPRGLAWYRANIPRVASRGCWGLGRYTHTAHKHADPSERVTIVNPIHPLHGRSLPIRQVCRVEHLIELIVEHPDGGVLTLPAWATDYAPRSLTFLGFDPLVLFDPAQLVQLARHVAAHRAEARSSCPPSLDIALPAQAGMPVLCMTTAVQGDHDDPTSHTTTVAAPSTLGRERPADPAHSPTRRSDARARRPNHQYRSGGAV